MATTKNIVELQISADGAVQSIDKVGTALDKASTQGQSLKAELRELNKQLATLDPNSEAFQELSLRAGEIKDKINDASEAIRANAGPAFESLSNNAGLLKDRLFNLDFEGVGQSLKGIGGSIGRISGKDITEGLKNVTSGFASLGKALLANPIFLIAGTIALIVANFDTLKSAVDGVTDAQQEQLAIEQEKAALAAEQVNSISEQENILKLQGKSEKEILNLKIAQSKEAIAQAEIAIETQKTLQKAQIDAAKRNQDIVRGILDFITLPIKALLSGIDSIGSAFGQNFDLVGKFEGLKGGLSSFVFDPEQVAKDGDAAIAEAEKKLTQLKNQQAGFQLQLNSIDQKARDERIVKRKEEQDALLKSQQEVSDLLLQLEAETAKELADAERAKLDALVKANQERLAIVDAQYKLEQDLSLQGKDKEIADLVAAYDEKFAIASGNAELEAQLTEQQRKDIAAINEKYDIAELARKQAIKDAQLQSALDVVGALTAINNSFQAGNERQARRQFQINKGLSIAEALISTYKAASGIYAAATLNPASVLFPGYPAIQMGVAIASGLAQVNKIRQQQFGGGGGSGGGSTPSFGGGGGGGGGTGATAQPQFNPINTNFLQNRPQQITAQTYVLAGDVANAQEARQKIDDLARL